MLYSWRSFESSPLRQWVSHHISACANSLSLRCFDFSTFRFTVSLKHALAVILAVTLTVCSRMGPKPLISRIFTGAMRGLPSGIFVDAVAGLCGEIEE